MTTKNANAIVRPRVDVWNVDSIEVLNRAYLEKTIQQNITFSETYDVPVYCGEFGAGAHCFENDRGGDRWMDDVMDIFHDADISFNYHAFHEGSVCTGVADFPLRIPATTRCIRCWWKS